MRDQTNSTYAKLRIYLDQIPIVDTHEHRTGVIRPVTDILDFYFMEEYMPADAESAAFGMPKDIMRRLVDGSTRASFDERWNLFQLLYKQVRFTAYSRGLQRGLQECWGVGDYGALETIQTLQEKFRTRDQLFYEKTMQRNNIRACIVDLTDLKFFMECVDGRSENYTSYCRFALRLSVFHAMHCKNDMLALDLERYLGRTITCLDDYLEAFEAFLKRCLDFGVICFKDHSAYRRTLAFGNPNKAEAEHAFNAMMASPRDMFGEETMRPLDDWLFHYFMRLAAKYRLPVQIHTGTVSRVRNEISKTNAVLLTPVLELHQDVHFDLFHGNWPYMDEYLFLGKNYPNVTLNLCWLHCIDPQYAVTLMKRAVQTIPHTKLYAYGGDCRNIELMVGYLAMAKDNAARAMTELIEEGWLNEREAKEILFAWFFKNPNEGYRLGLTLSENESDQLAALRQF